MRQQQFFFSGFRFFLVPLCLTAILGCVFLLFSSASHAAYVVDTGAGRTDVFGGMGLSRRCDAVAACDGDWLAGKFSIDSDVSVNSIEGWIGVSPIGSNGGQATAVLYTDGEGGRIPGDILYSADFLVPDASETIEVGWHGVFGKNWVLSAGTYWVGFEVYPYEVKALDGFMSGRGISNPLERYASISGPTHIGADWQRCCERSTESLGFRIDATAVVPLPPGIVFFIFSLLSLAVSRRWLDRRWFVGRI